MQGVYSIFDRVADEFGPLLVCKSDAVAIRAVRKMLQGAQPSEFQLFCLGRFNATTGELLVEDRRPVDTVMGVSDA